MYHVHGQQIIQYVEPQYGSLPLTAPYGDANIPGPRVEPGQLPLIQVISGPSSQYIVNINDIEKGGWHPEVQAREDLYLRKHNLTVREGSEGEVIYAYIMQKIYVYIGDIRLSGSRIV